MRKASQRISLSSGSLMTAQKVWTKHTVSFNLFAFAQAARIHTCAFEHTHTITLPHAYVRSTRVDPQANAHSPAHPAHERTSLIPLTHAGTLIPFPGELKRPTESASGYDLSFSQKVNAVLEPDPKAAAPYCNDYAGRVHLLALVVLAKNPCESLTTLTNISLQGQTGAQRTKRQRSTCST